ncbi:MAG: UDP-3-O-(3-hydroxymyristoyl)glucosamine N-acyltransferase [Parachlamydiaceae bacterium]|nr:UDP-3-O-(3-hydroxymyristoyl)glucosamine N-acyltransferase [Parachlamydiaceae bacterium]
MKKKIFTLKELSKLTDSSLIGDPQYCITNVADLESSGPEDASFLSNPQYEKAMQASKAGVIFMAENVVITEGRNFLITENPSRAFQITLEAFLGNNLNQISGFSGIHPTAVIHETAKFGKNVVVGPHAVIDQDVTVGDNTIISSGCYVGLGSSIGSDCLLHPKVIIRERCQIGNRVILQPGAVLGSCGFGFTTDKQGRHTKLNQVGIVVIEDDVEIGANTTIDRSRFKATIIGRGSKIDNLVQIAHGVIIGQNNIIVAQTGIAGSAKTGNYVVIGGQVAVAGHISISDKVMIAARSGVSKSIMEPGKYGGLPAIPLHKHQRNTVFQRNIETYIDHIKELQNQIKELQEKLLKKNS